MVTISEYRDADAAVADVQELSQEVELLNHPANVASPYVRVEPTEQFTGMGEISISLDDSLMIPTGVTIRRANPNSNWIFTELDTTIVEGKAVAQTSQGGIFVAGSGVNYSLVVGLCVAAVVLVLVGLMVVATVVYFVVRPEKWKSAKTNVAKTQMKVKRSFAKQV